jgi:DNA repair exonuclease SbcCD ATPase subunit
MGRKALHTQDEVFAAADQLAAGGHDVTATALLAALGGGSLTTIYRHLAAWEASRKDAPRPVAIDMPDTVSAAFAQAWQAAAREAGKEIAAIRDKADAETKILTKRFEEALAAIERLEAEANEEAGRLDALTARLAEQDSALRDAATDKAALAATVEQMRRQIAAQQAELERVHAEAEAERKERKAEIDRLAAELARERQAGEAARQQAAATGERQRRESAEQAAELARRTALLDAERETARRAHERAGQAEAARDAARQEASAAREEAARWRGQAEALQAPAAPPDGAPKPAKPRAGARRGQGDPTA